MHPLYDVILNNLKTDIGQMAEEGHPADALLAELDRARAAGTADALLALQEELWSRPSPPGFPYLEPSDWPSIAAHFPQAESHERFHGDEAALGRRLLGAWQGRCAGCQLGKPFEGAWPKEARDVCQASGSWPLADYLNPIEDPARLKALAAIDGYGKRIAGWQGLTRGRFDRVAADDDINYAIVGLLTLERHGVNFTTDQAMAVLRAVNPQGRLFAAGLNMVQKSGFGLAAPYTAVCGNAFRQSLGAQIRCDPFGWAAPANPALAARMAYEDARGSQTRNGIYSGIFFAVAIADAFSHGDPVRAIDTARQYVPPRSRFAEMVRFTCDACRAHSGWEAANDAIYARYDQDAFAPQRAPMNHSLINAAIVIMALLKGEGDFTRTLGISVMGGRDTDCNGATAGSILGCALGDAGIPRQWTEPLRDTVCTDVLGLPTVAISELARRTWKLSKEHVRYDR